MSKFELGYLSNFGRIKFAEENNLCSIDYQHSLKKYFKEEKHIHGKYKFGEVNSELSDDFEKSLEKYFR
ncbi:MAG: hypothetical protein ACQERB_13930 [Promethearchaeati archaeon]